MTSRDHHIRVAVHNASCFIIKIIVFLILGIQNMQRVNVKKYSIYQQNSSYKRGMEKSSKMDKGTTKQVVVSGDELHYR